MCRGVAGSKSFSFVEDEGTAFVRNSGNNLATKRYVPEDVGPGFTSGDPGGVYTTLQCVSAREDSKWFVLGLNTQV
jgi:hypothetical protein